MALTIQNITNYLFFPLKLYFIILIILYNIYINDLLFAQNSTTLKYYQSFEIDDSTYIYEQGQTFTNEIGSTLIETIKKYYLLKVQNEKYIEFNYYVNDEIYKKYYFDEFNRINKIQIFKESDSGYAEIHLLYFKDYKILELYLFDKLAFTTKYYYKNNRLAKKEIFRENGILVSYELYDHDKNSFYKFDSDGLLIFSGKLSK